MWTVDVFTQLTKAMCWEACGRMMWHWHARHRLPEDRESSYLAMAGDWPSKNRGLTLSENDTFCRQLGMYSEANANPGTPSSRGSSRAPSP